MKVIRYQALGKTTVGITKEDGTYENVEQDLLYDVEHPYSEEMEELAKKEAYKGKYTVKDDGSQIVAPHNITAGEYVTIDGELYLATQNIPAGEPVVVGQNAIATTVEQQLYELKGE